MMENFKYFTALKTVRTCGLQLCCRAILDNDFNNKYNRWIYETKIQP